MFLPGRLAFSTLAAALGLFAYAAVTTFVRFVGPIYSRRRYSITWVLLYMCGRRCQRGKGFDSCLKLTASISVRHDSPVPADAAHVSSNYLLVVVQACLLLLFVRATFAAMTRARLCQSCGARASSLLLENHHHFTQLLVLVSAVAVVVCAKAPADSLKLTGGDGVRFEVRQCAGRVFSCGCGVVGTY